MSEQALVVKGAKGFSVITGCAHPGVVAIIDSVKSKLKMKNIYMTFGGFHLDGLDREGIDGVITQLKKMGVKKVGPTHCTGERAKRMFRGKYHENYIPVKAGEIIQL